MMVVRRTEATRGLLTPQSRRKPTPEDARCLESIPETTEKPPRRGLIEDPSALRQPYFGVLQPVNIACDTPRLVSA